MTSSTAAKPSPAADGVKVAPSAVAAANSKTASAGNIHAERGIGPCALIGSSLDLRFWRERLAQHPWSRNWGGGYGRLTESVPFASAREQTRRAFHRTGSGSWCRGRRA